MMWEDQEMSMNRKNVGGSAAPPIEELGLEQAFSMAMTRLLSDPMQLAQAQAILGMDYFRLFQRTALHLIGWRFPPIVVPESSDKRFRHKDWNENPFFEFLKQAYLLNAQHALKSIRRASSGMTKPERLQAEVFAHHVINAMSPSRFAMTSPDGWQETAREGGLNLVRRWNSLLFNLDQRTGLVKVGFTNASGLSPGGNDTYLCVSEGETRAAYENLDELIRYFRPHFEQGGFLEPCQSPAVVRLQMAGGEFCGNATRGLAAWVAHQYYGERSYARLVTYQNIVEDENGISFFVEVSGATRPLLVRCERRERQFWVEVEMPIWSRFTHSRHKVTVWGKSFELDKFEMEGIVHLLLDRRVLPFVGAPARQRQLLNALEAQLSLGDEPAIGLIWHSRELAIDPVLYVRATDSLVYETACGSGSLALAAACASKATTALSIIQPSGNAIDCRFVRDDDENLQEAYISGTVELLGNFSVPLP
jgi:diaminopimelate epimerase